MRQLTHAICRVVALLVGVVGFTCALSAAEDSHDVRNADVPTVVLLPASAHKSIVQFALINGGVTSLDLRSLAVANVEHQLHVSQPVLDPGAIGVVSIRFDSDRPDLITLLPFGLLVDLGLRERINRIETIELSADQSSAVAYFHTTGEPVQSQQYECHVNGQVAEAHVLAAFPTHEGEFVTLRIDPAQRIGEGAEILVELESSDVLWRGAGRLWSPFFLETSQFSDPVSVVAVECAESRARITLYNETKQHLVVEEVAIEGLSATQQIDGAAFPILPPDRDDDVEGDSRTFVTPIPGQGEYHCIITYRVAAEDELVAESPTQKLAFTIDTRASMAIGHADGPGLPGCIRLCSDGLHPERAVSEVWGSASEIRQASYWPMYARVRQGSSDRLGSLAPCCDLTVIGMSRVVRDDNGLVSFFESLANAHRITQGRFVMALGDSQLQRYAKDDLQWLALAALAYGSKGITCRVREDDAGHRALRDLEVLTPYLRNTTPTNLQIESETPGIHVTGLLSQDYAVFVVLNEWCTTTFGEREQPFYAAPRSHASISWNVGRKATITSVHEVMGGGAVAWSQQDGLCRIELPTFGVGCVIVAEFHSTDTVARGGQGTLSPVTSSAAQTYPVTSPIISMGAVELSTQTDVSVAIRNDGDEPVVVRSAGGHHPDDDLWFDDTLIPGHCTIDVHGYVVAQGRRRVDVVNTLLVQAKDEAPLFRVYVRYDSTRPIDVTPTRLFWPNVTRRGVRTVRINGPRSPHAVIRKIDAPQEVVCRLSSDAKAIEVWPATADTAAVDGDIMLSVEISSGDHHNLTIPFVIQERTVYAVYPPEIVIPQGSAKRRTITVISSFASPFRIDAHCVSEPAVKLGIPVGLKLMHDITVDVPNSIASPAIISVECADADGSTVSLEIPLRVVGMRSQRINSSDRSDSDSSAAGRRMRRAQAAIARLRALELHEDLVPWARSHLLLTYPVTGRESCQTNQAQVEALLMLPVGRGWTDAFELRRSLPFPKRLDRSFVLEDHTNQYLHALSVAGVLADTSIVQIDKGWFTVEDLLHNSMQETRLDAEHSWTVSAYAYYLELNAAWKNKFGEDISFLQLVRELAAQESRTCGGTHRLFALARTNALYGDSSGFPDDLKDRIRSELVEGAARLRVSKEPIGGVGQKIVLAGHTLEWLSMALPTSALKEPWVLQIVDAVIEAVDRGFIARGGTLSSDDVYWLGAACHAVSGLERWQERQYRGAVRRETNSAPPTVGP